MNFYEQSFFVEIYAKIHIKMYWVSQKYAYIYVNAVVKQMLAYFWLTQYVVPSQSRNWVRGAPARDLHRPALLHNLDQADSQQEPQIHPTEKYSCCLPCNNRGKLTLLLGLWTYVIGCILQTRLLLYYYSIFTSRMSCGSF